MTMRIEIALGDQVQWIGKRRNTKTKEVDAALFKGRIVGILADARIAVQITDPSPCSPTHINIPAMNVERIK